MNKTLKKGLLFFIGFFLIALIASKIMRAYMNSTTPAILNEIVEQSQENETLMNSIGGYQSYEFTYNQNEVKKDTLKFTIKIRGYSKTLNYTGYVIKSDERNWKLDKIDTTIVK